MRNPIATRASVRGEPMRHLLPIALCLTVVACSGTEPQKSATPSSSAAPLAKARDPEAGAVAGKPTSSNPTPKTPSSGDSMPAFSSAGRAK